MAEFENLSTVKFQMKMKPSAIRIYKKLFPGSELVDLRENGVKVHILDKEFGIDALLNLVGGQWVSIQEKYRANFYLKYLDFTQEYMNGVGTIHESPGEWFKLGAQLYFYGWANVEETDFEKWVLLDIPKYKLIVEKEGGLDKIGKIKKNKEHGSASFFCIPIRKLAKAFVAYHYAPEVKI
jgi:hypothetical protein